MIKPQYHSLLCAMNIHELGSLVAVPCKLEDQWPYCSLQGLRKGGCWLWQQPTKGRKPTQSPAIPGADQFCLRQRRAGDGGKQLPIMGQQPERGRMPRLGLRETSTGNP